MPSGEEPAFSTIQRNRLAQFIGESEYNIKAARFYQDGALPGLGSGQKGTLAWGGISFDPDGILDEDSVISSGSEPQVSEDGLYLIYASMAYSIGVDTNTGTVELRIVDAASEGSVLYEGSDRISGDATAESNVDVFGVVPYGAGDNININILNDGVDQDLLTASGESKSYCIAMKLLEGTQGIEFWV